MATYTFDHLVSLDLKALCKVLVSKTPTAAGLAPGQWRGVVEVLTMRLVDQCDGLSVQSLSTCSAALEHALEAAVSSGAMDRTESVIRRLNLGAAMFRKTQPNSGIGMLDPDHLVRLLFQEIQMSADEAQTLAVDWRSLDITQIQRLRAAKNLVSPALSFTELVPREELRHRLKAWKKVVPSLP